MCMLVPRSSSHQPSRVPRDNMVRNELHTYLVLWVQCGSVIDHHIYLLNYGLQVIESCTGFNIGPVLELVYLVHCKIFPPPNQMETKKLLLVVLCY